MKTADCEPISTRSADEGMASWRGGEGDRAPCDEDESQEAHRTSDSHRSDGAAACLPNTRVTCKGRGEWPARTLSGARGCWAATPGKSTPRSVVGPCGTQVLQPMEGSDERLARLH
jgi:hypothetical protein